MWSRVPSLIPQLTVQIKKILRHRMLQMISQGRYYSYASVNCTSYWAILTIIIIWQQIVLTIKLAHYGIQNGKLACKMTWFWIAQSFHYHSWELKLFCPPFCKRQYETTDKLLRKILKVTVPHILSNYNYVYNEGLCMKFLMIDMFYGQPNWCN